MTWGRKFTEETKKEKNYEKIVIQMWKFENFLNVFLLLPTLI